MTSAFSASHNFIYLLEPTNFLTCKPKEESLKSVMSDLFLDYIHFSFENTCSGLARAFPGGQVAHPEGQNGEENEESLRKNKKN